MADDTSTDEGHWPDRSWSEAAHPPPDPQARYPGRDPLTEADKPPMVGVSSPMAPPPPPSNVEQPFAVGSSTSAGQWVGHPSSQPVPPPLSGDSSPGQGRKSWTRGRIAIAVAAVIVLAIVGFGVLAAVYIGASNSLVDRSVPASAGWGDCYNNGSSKQPVDCAGPHHYEVYSLLEYAPDTGYPNLIDRRLGDQLCEDDFETYTGDNFFTSDYDYAERFPSENEWNAGNHITACVLFHAEFKRIDSPVGDLNAVFD